MKWPLSKLYKITPPTRLHLISRDKPESFSSRRSLLVAAFSYIIKKCIPPHPSRYSLDTFSRLGEGFYRYALCKKLGCSCQLPHSTTPDSYIQLCPRGTLTADQRRACAARPRGKNEKLPGGSLLLTRQLKFFPATGAGRQCRLPVLSA